jgi:hypothetical protein
VVLCYEFQRFTLYFTILLGGHRHTYLLHPQLFDSIPYRTGASARNVSGMQYPGVLLDSSHLILILNDSFRFQTTIFGYCLFRPLERCTT